MKETAVLKKSEKMGLSSVLGTSWSLLLAVLVPPESCDLFRIIQDRALSAFLCVTLVLDIIGWIAFLWTREDGDSLADREMQNRLGCDGLLAAHDFCTRRSPVCGMLLGTLSLESCPFLLFSAVFLHQYSRLAFPLPSLGFTPSIVVHMALCKAMSSPI